MTASCIIFYQSLSARYACVLISYYSDFHVEQGSTCIVNAASERDMAVFAAGMIKAYPFYTYLFIFQISSGIF